MKRFFAFVIMTWVGLFSGTTAHAESYGVNFDGYYVNNTLAFSPLPDNDPFGPPDAVQINWNNVHFFNAVNAPPPGSSEQWTITDDKRLNPITLTASMLHQGGNDGGPYNGTSDLTALYSTGMRDNDGVITITTDVAPYELYDLYIYSGNNAGAGFVLGANYTVQTGLTGQVSFQMGSLNGFSIVGPERVMTGILLIVR